MDNATSGVAGFVRSADTTDTFKYMGSLLSFMVNKREADDTFCAFWGHARRGAEPPPHVHFHENETYLMLEGEVDFFIEGSEHVLRAKPGDCVFLPVGRAHALRIVTTEFKAFLLFAAVPGHKVSMDDYFRKMAIGRADTMSLPDNMDYYKDLSPEELAAVGREMEEYGGHVLTPDEISQRLPLLVSG